MHALITFPSDCSGLGLYRLAGRLRRRWQYVRVLHRGSGEGVR
jgi:hypothetical protein